MANRDLFNTQHTSTNVGLLPVADTQNEAGGAAYRLSNEAALAQLASTGCLGRTFYASAEQQLQDVLGYAVNVDVDFVAQTAIYARNRGFMKDMPALLCAYVAAYAPEYFDEVFDRVVDNGKMLSTFVQILRSGVVGRKSFGTVIKRKIVAWLDARTDEQLVRASAGMTPSLADIVKMVHPRPQTASRRALYGWLLGRPYDVAALPPLLADYERFRVVGVKDPRAAVPDVPFQMLASLPLHAAHWRQIAERAPWQMTRMNLNTFARHGVFTDRRVTAMVAARLANADEVKRARVFPYQLLAAFTMATDVPASVKNALAEAMELAIENVPTFHGRVAVCVDVSGSMQSPVTGHRGRGATTAVRCIDVAALVGAAVLRKNRDAIVLPFEHKVVNVEVRRTQRVVDVAQRLAAIGGGGTNCSAPLRRLADERARVDLVFMVSDNESWVETRRHDVDGAGPTETMKQWQRIKANNPRARLVCLDIQPYTTAQAVERDDILHVGGFSDAVFDVVAAFAKGELAGGAFVDTIRKVPLSMTSTKAS